MEEIKHTTVNVNGIKMHIAEKGEGPVVLFLHGFPDIWYAWRRQILGLSSLGYRAVAPDLRGYGDSEVPGSISSYTCFHVVGDIIGLIDLIGVEKVFIVAHDFGAVISWYLCLFRPERVKAFVCLGMPYLPRDPNQKPVETLRNRFGDDFYLCRFQEPGFEAEIAQIGTKNMLKGMLSTRAPGPSVLPKVALKGHPDYQIILPSWLSEEDIDYYASKFDQTGFTGSLNYYRAVDLNWELSAAWTRLRVKVPVKFVVGEIDVIYTTPGVKEYVQNGDFKQHVPFLEEIIVIENAGHFIHQEKAEEINAHIHDFIKKF